VVILVSRAQKELGDDVLAKETFQALSEQFNFYGQLSREELGLPIYVPKKQSADEATVKQMAAKKVLRGLFVFMTWGFVLREIESGIGN